MQKEEAKDMILAATDRGAYVSRATDYSFVYIEGEVTDEPSAKDALEELLSDRKVVQVPTAGQSRSTVDYKKA